MPMTILMERHKKCGKTVLIGIPILTDTNPLLTPIRISAMSTIGINTATNRNLPPRHPPRTPPSQVFALRNQTLMNQTLMNRAGEQRDAVPTHLITKVLASHTDP